MRCVKGTDTKVNKLLEVKSSPGLEGIEGISNKDIAGKMIEGLEKDLKFSHKGS